MKNLILSLLLLLMYNSYSQKKPAHITIVKETADTLIINGYKSKSLNHIFNKVDDVTIAEPEYYTFGGVAYKSVRFIFTWKDEIAVTFVEWVDKRGNSILTSYRLKLPQTP